jgi:hypothetical protein
MKPTVLIAHIAPHFHTRGATVALILLCLVVIVGLVFVGTSEDEDGD